MTKLQDLHESIDQIVPIYGIRYLKDKIKSALGEAFEAGQAQPFIFRKKINDKMVNVHFDEWYNKEL